MRYFSRLVQWLLAATTTCLVAIPATAEDWFTMSGYPELKGSDLVEISPVLTTWQKQVTLEVRTSRKAEREGYGGVKYRSYRGMAAVDCELRRGWFLTLTFYSQPDWEGTPIKTASYQPEEAPMVFADIPGTPSTRLINAACAAVR